MFVNVLPDSVEEAIAFPRGTQNLVQCCGCGFVFNRSFSEEKVVYGADYHAERGHSTYYLQHIRRVADFIENVRPIQGQFVLEVACGDGEFLEEIVKREPGIAIGIDPSTTERTQGPLQMKKTLFDDSYLERMTCPVDLLINRHMIEHMLDPLEMLKRFRCVLAENGILYLETPRLDWILDQRAFFDFPYEHCTYYTDQFMPRLLNAAGFEIIAFEKSYDGQYFSICAKKCEVPTHVALAENEELRCVQESFSALLHTYSEVNRAEVLQSFCTETLQPAGAGCRISLNAADGIYLWGAAAKGVMCAVLLNQWPIAGLIDKNQYKAGKYIAGTGYPVLSPSQVKYPSVQGVIIENDAYTEEITAEVRKIDPNISVLSLSKLLGT